MSDGVMNGGRKSRRKSGWMAKVLRHSIEEARQMLHPGPFRIKETNDFVTVSDEVSLVRGPADAGRPSGKGLGGNSKHLLQVIASVATAIWRMRTKLEGQPSVELPSELRHMPRHVQAAWDALAAGDIEIQDPTGQRYVPGMAVQPITYSPNSSVPPNTIVETLKPTVFWKDILIQRADVILASPADEPGFPAQSVQEEETSK